MPPLPIKFPLRVGGGEAAPLPMHAGAHGVAIQPCLSGLHSCFHEWHIEIFPKNYDCGHWPTPLQISVYTTGAVQHTCNMSCSHLSPLWLTMSTGCACVRHYCCSWQAEFAIAEDSRSCPRTCPDLAINSSYKSWFFQQQNAKNKKCSRWTIFVGH